MARCGCASECLCTIQAAANGGTTVVGTGSVGFPYLIAAKIDPIPDNLLVSGPDGLSVSLAAIPVVVEDSDCISLTGDGTPVDPIVASPIVDLDLGNGLACTPSGLFATSIGKPLHTIVETNVDYEAQYGDLVIVDSSVSAVDVTLPPAADVPGGVVTVKLVEASNTADIAGYAFQTIDGSVGFSLSTLWESVTLVSSGIEWFKIGSI